MDIDILNKGTPASLAEGIESNFSFSLMTAAEDKGLLNHELISSLDDLIELDREDLIRSEIATISKRIMAAESSSMNFNDVEESSDSNDDVYI